MPKLPLNEQANAIRNIKFSEDRKEDIAIKEEMVSLLKEKTDYQKDEKDSKEKRERWAKIRDLAGDDPEKIQKLKDVLYTEAEQKEEIEGLPKLEKENFRIDSTDWKEIEDPNGVKVKVNPEGDVWEYLEGNQKGEQLFTKASAIRETKTAGKKLPSSWTVFKDIIEKKYEGNYQNFLEKENIKFSGWRNPFYKNFNSIDEEFNIWCEDGSNFNGNNNEWLHYDNSDNYGFSVRYIQD